VTATISEVKSGLVAFSNLDSITYHRTMNLGEVEMVFTVTVIVARATERPAEANVDAYTSPTGSASVRAAIEGDRTLGGKVDTLIVDSATGMNSITANDTEYLSVDFTVRVYAS